MSPNCHHLKKETRLRFLEEMSAVQEAVAKAFAAEKMNIELLGMVMPIFIGICFLDEEVI